MRLNQLTTQCEDTVGSAIGLVFVFGHGTSACSDTARSREKDGGCSEGRNVRDETNNLCKEKMLSQKACEFVGRYVLVAKTPPSTCSTTRGNEQGRDPDVVIETLSGLLQVENEIDFCSGKSVAGRNAFEHQIMSHTSSAAWQNLLQATLALRL